MSGRPIQPILLQQHPAYRTQIDVIKAAFPDRVAPVRPRDVIEHERWHGGGLARGVQRYLGRLSVLSLTGNEIAYVSGSIRPSMYRVLNKARSAYLDIDDPLSVARGGGRNILDGGRMREDALALVRHLGSAARLSFWSDIQLWNFLAHFKADESAGLVADGRLSVLPPAIVPQVDASDAGTRDEVRCLCIASGKFWHKGVGDAIAAVERLAGGRVPVSLTIVGSSIPPDWQAFIASRPFLSVQSQLSRSELNALFRAHDVMLFPSHHDTYGWVLLEAKSFGLPSVATDFYNRPEIVADGSDGLLVKDPFANPYLPLGGAPYAAAHLSVAGGEIRVAPLLDGYIDELAGAIGRLVRDRALLKRMGAAALASVQPHARFGAATRIARLAPFLEE